MAGTLVGQSRDTGVYMKYDDYKLMRDVIDEYERMLKEDGTHLQDDERVLRGKINLIIGKLELAHVGRNKEKQAKADDVSADE